MENADYGAVEDTLVARPAINPKDFERWNPSRMDHVFLYQVGSEEQDDDDNYRYRLTVVDRSATSLNHVTAAVLIPAGRESEFMFASQHGLVSLAASAGCARLIAVAFGRRHQFGNQEAVQEELTFVIQVLAQGGRFLPPAIHKCMSKHDFVIPIMALDGIGSRNILAEGETSLSGKFLVEQVKADSRILRRLYFMDNPFVIQSEVALVDNSDVVDKHFIAFEYHKHMSAGIIALSLKKDEASSGLIIGLGGGGLVNFVQNALPNNSLVVVELDGCVVDIAEKYFGFDRSDVTKVRVHIGDGLKLAAIESSNSAHSLDVMAKEAFNFIVIDVDSKDKTVGMSCPPQEFVNLTYLASLRALLKPTGVLAINVSARNPAMFELVLKNLKSAFKTVIIAGEENDKDDQKSDVNVVVFALSEKIDSLPLFNLMTNMKAVLHLETDERNSPNLDETICELNDSLAKLVMHNESGEPIQDNDLRTVSKKKGGNNRKKKGKKK